METLSIFDLSRELGVSVLTLRRWYAMGRMPAHVVVDGRVRWQREDIETWLESGCPSPAGRTSSTTGE